MLKTLLVANRGEIAIRILRAAAELGLRTVAVHSTDDADVAAHAQGRRGRSLDAERPGRLPRHRAGAAARRRDRRRRDPPRLRVPRRERRASPPRCAEAGITFVGPSPEVLALFGDKAAARRSPSALGVPVLRGHARRHHASTTPRRSSRSLGPGGAMMLKAVGRRRRPRQPGRDARPTTSPGRTSGAARRRRRPSATATSTPSSWSRGPATSRCRSSATAAAPSATCGSATAASSAATRSSSRSRRRRTSTRRCARPRSPTPCGWPADVALRQPRHVRVPGRRRHRPPRLHRGQPAAAGRAHRHRGGARHRPRAGRSSSSPAGASLAEVGLDQRSVPAPRGHRRAVPGEHGDDGRRRVDPPGRRRPHRLRGARRAPATAPTRSATPATARAPASTRCSPRSSCTRRRTRLARRPGQGRPGARRVPHRGRRRPTPASCRRSCATPTSSPATATTRFVDDHVAELVAGAARRAAVVRARPPRRPPGAGLAGVEGRHRRPARRARPRTRRRWPPDAAGRAAARRRRAGRAGRHRRRARHRCRARSCSSTWPTATRSPPASSSSSWRR